MELFYAFCHHLYNAGYYQYSKDDIMKGEVFFIIRNYDGIVVYANINPPLTEEDLAEILYEIIEKHKFEALLFH